MRAKPEPLLKLCRNADAPVRMRAKPEPLLKLLPTKEVGTNEAMFAISME
jgi:hypothetical protein